jgi:hypothetical protein
MVQKFDGMLEKYLPKFAEKVQLKLPQLKKLPTLKKVESE